MNGLMVVAIILVVTLLIMAAAVIIRPSKYSQFELERLRGKIGDEGKRTKYLDDLISLQRVIASLLLVVSVVLLVALSGWVVGIILSVILALEYGAVARMSIIQHFAQKRYEKIEPTLTSLAEKYPGIFSFLKTAIGPREETRIHSREEFLHLVQQSGSVLSREQMARINHGLAFENVKVSEVMTPKSAIDTIAKEEILGPLVLDDLHKTGHSRFPVIDQDINHIVGILYLKDVLRIDSGKSHTSEVKSAMQPDVFYIRQDHTLDRALAAFLKTRHHLFVVVNKQRETVGLLNLEDVIEKLTGQSFVDDFDKHDDLKAVAERDN